MLRRPQFLRSSVARFGMAGLGAVVVLGGLTLAAVSRISTAEALNAAKERARLAGYGIVEPALEPEVLDQSERSTLTLNLLDELVQTRVLSDRVVRVKVWSPEGRIVYSDEPDLIGEQFAPKANHAEVLRSGAISSEIAHTDGPENRFERSSGRLLEVYMPVRTTDGRQLVYEQYERYDSVTGNSRRLVRRLALPLGAGLALLWLTQLPLARSLAGRVRRAESERAMLLERAVTASSREREQVAADLHDGVMQDLAGLTFELSAMSASAPSGVAQNAIERCVVIARASMRQLRSSLVDLHPPSVHALGLSEAIEAIAERMRARGLAVHVNVDLPHVDVETASLLYRSTQELLRNVTDHAQATSVTIETEQTGGSIRLRVRDDGVGFSDATLADRRRQGHVGTDLQRALITRAGGTLSVASSLGRGTVATVELPQ